MLGFELLEPLAQSRLRQRRHVRSSFQFLERRQQFTAANALQQRLHPNMQHLSHGHVAGPRKQRPLGGQSSQRLARCRRQLQSHCRRRSVPLRQSQRLAMLRQQRFQRHQFITPGRIRRKGQADAARRQRCQPRRRAGRRPSPLAVVDHHRQRPRQAAFAFRRPLRRQALVLHAYIVPHPLVHVGIHGGLELNGDQQIGAPTVAESTGLEGRKPSHVAEALFDTADSSSGEGGRNVAQGAEVESAG